MPNRERKRVQTQDMGRNLHEHFDKASKCISMDCSFTVHVKQSPQVWQSLNPLNQRNQRNPTPLYQCGKEPRWLHWTGVHAHWHLSHSQHQKTLRNHYLLWSWPGQNQKSLRSRHLLWSWPWQNQKSLQNCRLLWSQPWWVCLFLVRKQLYEFLFLLQG